MTGDLTSEVDELTVAALWLIASQDRLRDGGGRRVSKAEVRRRLMAAACEEARTDPRVADLVAIWQAARARNPRPPRTPARRRGNVIPFRPSA